MKDMISHLEKLPTDAAECRLMSELAADHGKRELFAKSAEHHSTLASEIERVIAARTGNEAAGSATE